jgi:GT2 family glycosyltransferase
MQQTANAGNPHRLSVIVPVYNSALTLGNCLQALISDAQSANADIIVVNDGSTDGTAAVLAQYGVRVLGFRQNRGPGPARNLGANDASGEILVFVDADVTIAPGVLNRFRRYLQQHPQCAAVIGSYDHDPAGENLVSRYRNLLHHFVHQNTGDVASHFWTGLGAIRRSVFFAVGGFDETKYGRACEDIELGYRLRQRGYEIRIDRTIQGKHQKRWTLLSMIATDMRIRAIPWTHLLLEHGDIPADFSLGWSQRLSVTCAWLFAGSLMFALVRSELLVPAALALLFFLVINFRFLRMLARQCGLMTSIASVPLHLLYHFYSGAGILFGVLTFAWRRLTVLLSARSESA